MWAPPSQAYVVLRSDPWPLLIPGKYSTYCATFPASLPLLVVLRSPTLWAWLLMFLSTTVLEFVFAYFYYLEVSGGFAQEPCHWRATLCFLIFFFFAPMSSREIYCLSGWYYCVPISLGGLVCCFRCTYLEDWTTFPLLIWHVTFIMDCGRTHLLGLVSELSCPTPVVCVVRDSHLGHPYKLGIFWCPQFSGRQNDGLHFLSYRDYGDYYREQKVEMTTL